MSAAVSLSQSSQPSPHKRLRPLKRAYQYRPAESTSRRAQAAASSSLAPRPLPISRAQSMPNNQEADKREYLTVSSSPEPEPQQPPEKFKSAGDGAARTPSSLASGPISNRERANWSPLFKRPGFYDAVQAPSLGVDKGKGRAKPADDDECGRRNVSLHRAGSVHTLGSGQKNYSSRPASAPTALSHLPTPETDDAASSSFRHPTSLSNQDSSFQPSASSSSSTSRTLTSKPVVRALGPPHLAPRPSHRPRPTSTLPSGKSDPLPTPSSSATSLGSSASDRDGGLRRSPSSRETIAAIALPPSRSVDLNSTLGSQRGETHHLVASAASQARTGPSSSAGPSSLAPPSRPPPPAPQDRPLLASFTNCTPRTDSDLRNWQRDRLAAGPIAFVPRIAADLPQIPAAPQVPDVAIRPSVKSQVVKRAPKPFPLASHVARSSSPPPDQPVASSSHVKIEQDASDQPAASRTPNHKLTRRMTAAPAKRPMDPIEISDSDDDDEITFIGSSVRIVTPSIVAPSNPQTKPLAQFQARVNKALEKEPVQVASVTFVNTIDDTVPADFEYVESELEVHPTVSVRPTQRSAGVACSECLHCRDLTDEQRAALSGLQGEDRVRAKFFKGHHYLEECGECCEDPDNCRFRLSRRPRTFPVEIFKTANRGWGVRPRCMVPKRTFLDIYIGTIWDGDVDLPSESYTYNLDGPSEDDRFKHELAIDASKRGNFTRFFNHSCSEANVKPMTIIRTDLPGLEGEEIPLIGFVTTQTVKDGDEFLLNYRGRDTGHDAKDIAGWKSICLCGSPNCRGRLDV